MIRASELNFKVPEDYRRRVKSLMTPEDLLKKDQFPEAEQITHDKFTDFDSILARREDIRNLKLLPIKHPEHRVAYHKLDKVQLLHDLFTDMGKDQMMFGPNAFPYHLPKDLVQGIVWVLGRVTSYHVPQFIAKVLMNANYPLDKAIIFERPPKATQPLVKGTFPQMRHIHLWTKNVDE